MSPSVLLYLMGGAAVFASQRLVPEGSVNLALTVLGLALLLGAVAARAQAAGPTEAHRAGNKLALRATMLGLSALVVYGLTLDMVTDALGLGDEMLRRWNAVFGSLWPIVALAGSLPLIAIDRVLQKAPIVVQPRRITQAGENALIAALALALVFPVNFLAKEHNKRWDLAYFKTAEAGTATQALVDNLDEPIVVRVFLPTSSDVRAELKGYFASIDGGKLSVQWLDHAAEPTLAKELKVRDNGYIAITRGELGAPADGEEVEEAAKPVTETLKIGTDLDAAKRTLRKLDQEFQKALLEVAKGERVAYVVTGHGELSWRGSGGPGEKASGAKKLLEAMNFKVKELGLSDGLGDAVPDDADVVLLLGPRDPYLQAETDALVRYLEAGGSLFVALEPDFSPDRDVAVTSDAPDPFDALLERLGLAQADGVLASESSIVRATYNKLDRVNVVSNRFSSHASVLSRMSRQMGLVFQAASPLEEIDGGDNKVTVTVRSLPDNWADLDGDLELDDTVEEKKIRPVAAVSTGGEGDSEWRAVVIGDATAFSDLALQNRGNQQYLFDGLNWLIGEEEASGTVENEEDIKIEHTREDQVAWFYGTTLGVPFIVLLAGVLRVRSRRGA